MRGKNVSFHLNTFAALHTKYGNLPGRAKINLFGYSTNTHSLSRTHKHFRLQADS